MSPSALEVPGAAAHLGNVSLLPGALLAQANKTISRLFPPHRFPLSESVHCISLARSEDEGKVSVLPRGNEGKCQKPEQPFITLTVH